MSSSSSKRFVLDVALFLASQAALFYSVSWAIEAFGSDSEKRQAKAKSIEVLKRLGRKNMQLSEYEQIIAAEVIHPDDIEVKFSDIGGLDPIISSLRESVIFPLVYPTLFTSSSSLLSAPKGVLLYGPPGCGKTMLAKALAKESGATFINIAVSVLTTKWYGESNKLVAGLFGLAKKMQPSIIFIDEIDSFLRERGKSDHEATAMIKAEFMTLWDGLLSGTDRIMVLGATNRPSDIDSAILRRMPKRFAVPLPDVLQRRKILELTLRGTQLTPDFSMDELALRTANYSGSDLKEVCRNAAMHPVREYMRENADNQTAMEKGGLEGYTLRPLTMQDFLVTDAAAALPESFVVQDRSRLDIDE
ncbi:P-loop containing nucleoside triphosphate hydrolase protein [Gautieria morchelliformis]|nr:P-loop containing nucleoside triphosphate hydrolase protein [Gautieria morchelliformis]